MRRVRSVIELYSGPGQKKGRRKYYVLHQANERIIEGGGETPEGADENCNNDEFGNTSTASIPLLLDDMIRKGVC